MPTVTAQMMIDFALGLFEIAYREIDSSQAPQYSGIQGAVDDAGALSATDPPTVFVNWFVSLATVATINDSRFQFTVPQWLLRFGWTGIGMITANGGTMPAGATILSVAQAAGLTP